MGAFRFSHFKMGRSLIVPLGLGAVLSACDGQVHLDGGKNFDFSLSEISSSGSTPADSASWMTITIRLKNSDGTAVTKFTPTYEILSGTGVTGEACTVSGDDGVSTCRLKSSQAGSKRLSVKNIKISLTQDLIFSAVSTGGMLTGVSPAAGFSRTSSSGHKISGSVGSLHSDLVKTNGSGWKIYGGPEGNALSR